MHLPDSCTPADIDRNQAGAEDIAPDAARRLEEAHRFYRVVLNDLITRYAQFGYVMIDPNALELIMEDVMQSLGHELDAPLEQARERGLDMHEYPEDHRRLCLDAKERLYDAFRLKPVQSDDLITALTDIARAASASAAQAYPAAQA